MDDSKIHGVASMIFGAAIGLMIDSGISEKNLRELFDVTIEAVRASRTHEPAPEQVERLTDSILDIAGPDLEWRMREIMKEMEAEEN